MTTAWFHCFSGVAGDMALGSLIDAGADAAEVREALRTLPVHGWELEVEPVLRGGIAGTKVHVHAEPSTVVRTAAHIQGLVAEARLPERVQQRASAVFAALAVAEGRLHRRPPEQVHFHEVGGIDAIVDVVGTCVALELLGVDEVTCSPVAVGLGMVRAAHGIIPNPSPAVVELLAGIPTRGVDLPVELTTPTGAAIVAALASRFGPLPEMEVRATGFGAGTRELPDRPNLTQVVLGEPIADVASTTTGADDGQPVVLLEANLDDATGEVLAHAVAAALDAGAHDAWLTPIVMKKGRPAHVLSVLADPALTAQLARVVQAETGTLGVRAHRIARWAAPRHHERVVVDGLSVRVKVSPGRAKAEYDDAAAVAARTGRAVRDVMADAERRWHDRAHPTALHLAEDVQEPSEPIPHHDHPGHPDRHDHHPPARDEEGPDGEPA